MIQSATWTFYYEYPEDFIDVLVINESAELYWCIYLN